MKEITTHGVKRIIFALGMLVSLLQATPCRAEQVYEIDLIKYSITDELNHEVMVTHTYKTLREETTIPAKVTIDGQEYTVTAIGDDAFIKNTSIKFLTLPETITRIGNRAFQECSNLVWVNLPDAITEIGEAAFCESCLQTLVIPPLVEEIKDYTFYKTGLSGDLIIPEAVKRIGKSAFSSCYGIMSVTIPKSVTDIGDEAFYYSGLRSVELPESGTIRYGEYAFAGTKLSTAPLNNSVVSIGNFAFRNCAFRSVTIPASVEYIGGNIFYDCDLLRELNVDEANKNYCAVDNVLYTKDMKTLVLCPVFKRKYEMPSTVTVIGKYAMFDCKFYYFKISESLEIIEDYGMRCYMAETNDGELILKLPNNVTRIGECALPYRLKEIFLRAAVQEIGKNVFTVTYDYRLCVTCFTKIPPKIDGRLGTPNYGATLYVLKGCAERYESDPNWKSSFKHIYELDRSDIEDIESDRTAIPAEYFNLRGVKVSPDAMAPGYYIKRQGSYSEKILVK